KGVVVDFTNTIIILTSNIASDKIMAHQGDAGLEDMVLDELKRHFKPEFLNRLDDVVVFNPLGEAQILSIVDLFFADIAAKVEERDITLTLTDAAKRYIASAGFDPVYGARPLKRALYEIVEDRLADLILGGEVEEGSSVTFDASGDEINVTVA
ncbi:MAG: AAA family ATPase, partial [Sulfuricurvum sp.]|nr:AAA family ATPase [Sulfuricurvum sp.]